MMERPALSVVKPSYGVKAPMSPSESAALFTSCLSTTYSQSLVEATPGSALDSRVVWLDGVLSAEECAALTVAVDKSSSLTFWNPDASAEARAFRNADTVEMNNPSLAEALWARVCSPLSSAILPISFTQDEDRELEGMWAPAALNHDLLIAKYPPGGSFAPHTDGRTTHDFNRRSFLSVIIFLNDIAAGGGTRFYKDEVLSRLLLDSAGRWTGAPSDETLLVSPVRGRILVFDQDLVHEGVPPSDPHNKYIIRSDVMFQRTPPACTSERDVEAYKMFRRAEDLAEAGDVQQSLALFAASWKLSPAMSKMMGQS